MTQSGESEFSSLIAKDHVTLIPGLSRESYSTLATASSVRIYHAQLGSQDWYYSQLKGTLLFGRNNDDENSAQTAKTNGSLDFGKYWFRLLDESSGILKQVWLFKLPVVGFSYERDRPFFHAFNGMSRSFGFLFDDDDEARNFFQSVSQITPLSIVTKKRSMSFPQRRKSPSQDSRRIRGSISPSMISLPAPNSFVHVAHVGLTPSGDIEASKGVDPSWVAMLKGYGALDGQKKFPVTNFSDNRKVEVASGEGYWIGGFDDFRQRHDKGTNEAGVEEASTKRSLKERRRLPTTRSFSIF